MELTFMKKTLTTTSDKNSRKKYMENYIKILKVV